MHGASRHHLELLNFVGRQFLDIFAPSNFIASNPEVQRAALETGGMNFVRGFGYAAEDLRRTLLKQPIEGAEAFVPGQHVAVTPGRWSIALGSPRSSNMRRRPAPFDRSRS